MSPFSSTCVCVSISPGRQVSFERSITFAVPGTAAGTATILSPSISKNTFFRGLVPWLGFSHATVPFDVAERAGGTSKWSKLQLARLAVNAITSFSSLPLQIVTILGLCFLAGSLVLGIQTLYMYLSGIAVTGFTTVILLLLIIGSAIMISLGIIGIYISKIFDEVKGRPRFIVAETVHAREAARVAGLTSPRAPSP